MQLLAEALNQTIIRIAEKDGAIRTSSGTIFWFCFNCRVGISGGVKDKILMGI